MRFISTPHLTIQGGARISSSTFGAGNAGTITINAPEQLTVTGTGVNVITDEIEPSEIRTAGVLLPSTFRAAFGLPDNVTGRGGDIVLNTGVLSVTDGAQVNVSHDDLGDAGSLAVNARQALIRNEGKLLASTQSGNGGDIQLSLQELLFARDNGLIDTESLGTGNGGNITIDASIIFGLDNSDIVANAVIGDGGNINITTQALYGLEFRDQLTTESDITASSEFGVNGTVEVNTLAIDPAEALVEFPSAPADASDQIADACTSSNGNQFIASGRGGLPVSPTDSLVSNRLWSDIRNLSAPAIGNTTIAHQPRQNIENGEASDLIEANGWQVDQEGNVELLTAIAPATPALHTANCLAQAQPS